MKIQKFFFFFFFLGGGGGGGVRVRGVGSGWGGQGGWERRIEAIVKIEKKKSGWGDAGVGSGGWGSGRGVRVDGNGELKLL